MAKKNRLLLAHKLASAMLSLLRIHPRHSATTTAGVSKPSTTPPPPPTDASATPPPVVRHGAAALMSTLAGGQQETTATTLVVDVDSALLLRSGAGAGAADRYFPYFMLVALEAGGYLRGLLLLLLYPLLLLLSRGAAVRLMAAAAFCGLRASRFRAGRAVLPKWLMDGLAAEAFAAVRAAGDGRAAVCVTAMPRVMVDGFLREYLGVDRVVAPEMKVVWGFYTGIMEDADGDEVMAAAAEEEVVDEEKRVVGFAGSAEFLDHPLAPSCKVRTTCEDYYNWLLLFFLFMRHF